MRRKQRSMVLGVVLASLTLQITAVADAALPLQRKKCGQVVKTSFRLANDLSCSADGLKVGASGIVIDLNGHTLRGDGGDDDYGIDNTAGHDRVVIRGRDGVTSRIIGFHDGIKVGAGGVRNTVRWITLLRNSADGIDLDGGHHHKVLDTRILRSGENGIESAGNDLTLLDDVIVENKENGVRHAGERAIIRRVDARRNVEAGIHLQGSDGTLSALEVTGNHIDGLLVDGSQNQVANVTAIRNLQTGVSLLGGGNTLTAAKVRENGSLETGDAGIAVFGPGNLVTDGIVRDNLGDGIHVSGDQTTVLDSKVCGNAFGEIVVVASGAVLEGNTVTDVCPLP